MSVCDVPVISSVCDAVGEGTASLIAAPFDWLAQAMGGAAAWLFEAVWMVFDTTTLVDVQSEAFVSVYNILFGIAVFVMFGFFCLQLATGLIKRDPTALSRAALGLGKSVLGSFVVITLTALLLEIVDRLCVGIIQAAGETTESMGTQIGLLVAGLAGINIGAPGVGAIITIFLAGLAIAAAAIVWLSLLIRKALILVAIALAPLAFSGAAWEATRGWIGKWAMFVIALIVSKLVLVVIFLVAISQLSAPIDGDLTNIADPLAGIVLMMLGAFAPYLVYRFISFLGFDLYNQMGTEQEAKNALNRPVPVPSKPSGEGPKKVLDDPKSGSGQSGGEGGGNGGPPKSGSPTGGGQPPGGATSAGTGVSSSSAGAGGAGASGAGGPIVAGIVLGAKALKKIATAGKKGGEQLGQQADTAAGGAEKSNDGATPPPSTPPPNAPSGPKAQGPNDSGGKNPPPPKPTEKG